MALFPLVYCFFFSIAIFSYPSPPVHILVLLDYRAGNGVYFVFIFKAAAPEIYLACHAAVLPVQLALVCGYAAAVKAGMGKGYCLCVGLAYISAVADEALCRYVGYTIAESPRMPRFVKSSINAADCCDSLFSCCS